MCERRDVFASTSAVARILPLFSAKSTAQTTNRTVTVEFLLVDGSEALTADDVECLDALAYGVRLAAKVVDIPCADMHTDTFLDVSYSRFLHATYISVDIICSFMEQNRLLELPSSFNRQKGQLLNKR